MPGRLHALVGACAVYVAMFGPSTGRARAGLFTVNLDYERANGCPDAKEFKALVESRLGYEPFSERASDHVLVRIAPGGAGLNGSIEWRDSTGRWIGDQTFPLASTDCHRLARTLALALTVQIRLLATTADPNPRIGSSESTGAPPEAPAPKSTPPSSVPVIPAEKPPSARGGPGSSPREPTDREPWEDSRTLPPTLRSAPGPEASPPPARAAMPSSVDPWPVFAISTGPSVGLGMSSGPVLLGRVLGSVAWRSVSLELAAEASPPTTTRRADGAGFAQQHLLASTAACAVLQHWSACLLAKAGEVRMAGENIDLPTSAVVPIVEAGARVGVVHPLGRHFLVSAHADGLTNVTRWTATLDQIPVWTAPRFAAVLGFDLGVRSP